MHFPIMPPNIWTLNTKLGETGNEANDANV